MTPLDDWLSVKEASRLSDYHENHLRRLLRAGEITARKWGNVWMVYKPSLFEYLKRAKIQGEKRGPK